MGGEWPQIKFALSRGFGFSGWFYALLVWGCVHRLADSGQRSAARRGFNPAVAARVLPHFRFAAGCLSKNYPAIAAG